jgi:predicted RNA-binding protein
VRTVIVNGEVLMQDRMLVRHEEKQILADARQANRDLMDRVNKLAF